MHYSIGNLYPFFPLVVVWASYLLYPCSSMGISTPDVILTLNLSYLTLLSPTNSVRNFTMINHFYSVKHTIHKAQQGIF